MSHVSIVCLPPLAGRHSSALWSFPHHLFLEVKSPLISSLVSRLDSDVLVGSSKVLLLFFFFFCLFRAAPEAHGGSQARG